MLKYFFISVLFFNITYSQNSIDKIINESWVLTKQEFFSSLKTEDFEKREAMGYSGFVIVDTLNSNIVEIGYFFNSEGIQSMRGISNKNKSEKESKKLFDFLYSSVKELLGKPISENEMLGSKIIQWKNKNSKIFINYNSETCMLSILK